MAALCSSADRGQVLRGEAARLNARDGPGHGGPVAGQDRVGVHRVLGPEVDVEVADDRVDHPGEPHPLAVLGREDPDAAAAQALDLVVDDHPAPAADDLDVAGAARA